MEGSLPTGTVTFLFTDVEGSTKLLYELGPERYRDVLSEHRRVLRDAFRRHGGVEVDTQGDAFFVAFASAPGALAAAREAQEALEVPVRMGIHTGTPLLAAEDYIGADVHRAARIAAAGHGGQVLVSAATAALVAEELRDLGEHRLKDLSAPERISQLGEGDFPPLKTLYRTNLPVPATPFLGREDELASVLDLLEETRLLTLTGPGGTGKTRLALQAGAEASERFPDGVFWVPLAPLRDPGLVLEQAGQAVGASDGVAAHVGDKHLLLLLDNFEHLMEAADDLIGLHASCPNLRLLVTSRELLRIPGEQAYPVPPLDPQDGARLFVARARAAKPDFEPDDAVWELCARLENLPLALELAAARLTVLSPQQLLERLVTRLDLLKAGRGVDPRQQTLRATIEWSHELLDEHEQRLFARLSVFAGGCTLEAVEQVCDADLDTLQSLVDKSLVRVREGNRFWMLETIREYALERLELSGEVEVLRMRHADYVLGFAKDAEPFLLGGALKEWVPRVDAERDNIRTALDWSLRTGRSGLALELAAALERYWWGRAPAEGLSWLERALDAAEAEPNLRAAALDAAGGAAWFLGSAERALPFFQEALRLYREIGNRPGIAASLSRHGPPLVALGRVDEAEAAVQEALAVHRELGPSQELGIALNILASIASERGEYERADSLYRESTEVAHELGDEWGLVWNLHNRADLALDQDEPDQAFSLAFDSLSLARETGDDQALLVCLGILSVATKKRGDDYRAGLFWGAAERVDEELGENMWQGEEHARLVAMLGERSGTFEEGVDKGRRLAVDETVALATADA